MSKEITVETTVNAPIERAWAAFNDPEHVKRWNHASDDWHSPSATNDLRQGGRFSYRMEAKDGSEGFDFEGVYDEVVENERVCFTMGDGRKVRVAFVDEGDKVRVVETFEAEGENPEEMQREGWQAILDNYKRHAESLG